MSRSHRSRSNDQPEKTQSTVSAEDFEASSFRKSPLKQVLWYVKKHPIKSAWRATKAVVIASLLVEAVAIDASRVAAKSVGGKIVGVVGGGSVTVFVLKALASTVGLGDNPVPSAQPLARV